MNYLLELFHLVEIMFHIGIILINFCQVTLIKGCDDVLEESIYGVFFFVISCPVLKAASK